MGKNKIQVSAFLKGRLTYIYICTYVQTVQYPILYLCYLSNLHLHSVNVHYWVHMDEKMTEFILVDRDNLRYSVLKMVNNIGTCMCTRPCSITYKFAAFMYMYMSREYLSQYEYFGNITHYTCGNFLNMTKIFLT